MDDRDRELRLLPGQTYLIRIDANATFEPDAEEPGTVIGEARLLVTDQGETHYALALTSLGLVSAGVRVTKADAEETQIVNTGRISVGSQNGRGSVVRDSNGWQLEVEFETSVVYQQITVELGYEKIADHVYETPSEMFTGSLNGRLSTLESNEELALVDANLRLDYSGGGLGLMQRIDVSLPEAQLESLPDRYLSEPGGEEPINGNDDNERFAFVAHNLAGCPQELIRRRRRLRVQKVFVTEKHAATSVSKTATDTMFEAAAEIWGKACIDLEVLEPPHHLEVDAETYVSDDIEMIFGEYHKNHSPDDQAICVFLTDRQLTEDGGGVMTDGGTGIAKVLLTSRVVNGTNAPPNPNLLAHEMGHVLHGLHPEDMERNNWWIPIDSNTVMAQSGNIMLANLALNTLFNCQQAKNDALITGTVDGCMTPDP